MEEDEQIITTHVGCEIALEFGESNFREAEHILELGMSYINALFPTTTKYGGVYSCSFDEFFESIERDENRFEDAAKTVILWGKDYLKGKFTDDMIFHMHKAIESYAEHFPNNPIYKQALKEFD